MAYDLQRRLAPIHDALDYNQNQLALNQCNKVLKKHPTLLPVKALKALALDRLGQKSEALKLCEEVVAQKPADDATLQPLLLTLRSLMQHSLIVTMYKNASESRPNDEEILNHLFMAHVRARDFKGQQQVATSLNKLFKSNRYLFWNLASLVQQAAFGETENERSFALTLSERFLKKCIEDNRIESIEELKLYLIVLEMQDKRKEAYDFLCSGWGEKFKVAMEGDKLKLKLAVDLNLWPDVYALCKKIISADANDWDSFKLLIESLSHLSKEDPAKIDEGKEFISSLVEDNESLPLRGPLLAELELLCQQQPAAADTLVSVVDRLVGYFKLFGHKLCCCEDLKPYILLLDDQHRNQVMEMLKATLSSFSDKSAVNQIYRHICLEKFQRIIGCDPQDTEQSIETCEKRWNAYIKALDEGKSLEVTERQHGDDYVLLASHQLFACFRETRNVIYACQAIAILEYALCRSKFNFQFKLLLIRFYLQLGAFKAALDVYQSMDVKYILNDTVSHVLVDHINALGSFITGTPLLRSTLSIYVVNKREVPEMMCQAYKHSTLTKVLEFMRFENRLGGSIQKVICEHEMFRSQVFMSVIDATDLKGIISNFENVENNLLNYSDSFVDSLRDNRDRDTMNSWESLKGSTVEECTRTDLVKDKTWIKLRALELQIMNAACTDQTALDQLESALNTLNQSELSSRERFFLQFASTVINLCRSTDFVGSFLSNLENTRNELIPKNDQLCYDNFANITTFLEILVHAYAILVRFKLFKMAETRQRFTDCTSSILRWLRDRQQWTQNMSSSDSEQKLMSQLVLTGAAEPQDFVPILNFVVDQSNEPFIMGILKDKLLESWKRSLKQMADLCQKLDSNAK